MMTHITVSDRIDTRRARGKSVRAANNHPSNETFFKLTPNVRDKLLAANLTASEWRIWCYLVSLDPFGDRGAKFSSLELMSNCGVKKSTYFTAKAKFQRLGLFQFIESQSFVLNTSGNSKQQESQDLIVNNGLSCSQQIEIIESKILSSNSKILEQESELEELKSNISESQTAKPLSLLDSDCTQTRKKLQTNQTEVVVEKASEEKLTNHQATSQQRQNPASIKGTHTQKIPQDLLNKLEELEIPLDRRVLAAIANYDISQAYGAVAHVERTWETIDNPRSIFLFQLPKQPIEALGSRLPVRRASDWGYTLEDLKRMYPSDWKNAANHFGLEVE